jgi:hypothetical protein
MAMGIALFAYGGWRERAAGVEGIGPLAVVGFFLALLFLSLAHDWRASGRGAGE